MQERPGARWRPSRGAISVDNGTGFTARALDHWAYTHRVELDYSRPGKPTDNAFIEAFNSPVRREYYRSITFKPGMT